MASVYVKQNQTQEALQTFSFLLHLNPKDESIHVQMAKIEEDLGNIENAITHYKKTTRWEVSCRNSNFEKN